MVLLCPLNLKQFRSLTPAKRWARRLERLPWWLLIGFINFMALAILLDGPLTRWQEIAQVTHTGYTLANFIRALGIPL